MRVNRKPDLLILLVIFVCLGLLVSGYIQYLETSAERLSEETSGVTELVSIHNHVTNQVITVDAPEVSSLSAEGDTVNNSLQQP